MFNIFKKLKQFKMNEQELAAVQEERGKMYDAVSRLTSINKEQSNIIAQLKIDLNDAQNRVRDLSEQLNRIYAQQRATNNFNDNDRNY
jgi:hypothetical protein